MYKRKSYELIRNFNKNERPILCLKTYFFRILFQYIEPSVLKGDFQGWQRPITKILQESI